MEKNEMLAELYSVRAGMSLISQMRDDITVVKGTVDTQKSDIYELEKKKNSIQDELKKLRAARCDAQVKRFDEKRDVSQEEHPFGCLTMIIAFIATLGLFSLIGWVIFNSILKVEWPGWYWGVMAGAIFIIPFAAFFRYYFASEKSSKESFEIRKRDNLNKLEKNIEEKQSELFQINRQIHNANEKRIRLEVDLTEIEGKRVKEAKETYGALTDKFSTILDPRDWQNIDLVIYYFETGRADTLKEALQLVDKERQMNTLIASIAHATTIISREIRISMQKISREIKASFEKMSKQIDEQNKILRDININQEGIFRETSSIAEESKVQSALLSKINVSSNKLAEDIDYMIYRKH